MNDTQPEWVVVLVHGAWDSGASWMRASSRLCGYIRTRFPRVHFNRLLWSGRNSHRDRVLAADRLSNRLVALRRRFPAAKVVVIAHSHGGNVALYACRRDHIDQIVAGVFCLATPFLNAYARRVWGNIPVAAFTTALLASIVGLVLAPTALPVIGCSVLAIVAAIAIFVQSNRRLRRGLHYDMHSAAGFCDQLTVKAPPSTRLFILATDGDETGALLAASQLMQWVTRALVEYPQWLPSGVRSLKRRMPALSPAIDAAAFITAILGNAVSVFAFPLAFVTHVFTLRLLGVSVIRDAMRMSVTAEPIPSGECTAVQLPAEHQSRSIGVRSHTDPTNNERVSFSITRWMEQLLDPSEASAREKRRDAFYGFGKDRLPWA